MLKKLREPSEKDSNNYSFFVDETDRVIPIRDCYRHRILVNIRTSNIITIGIILRAGVADDNFVAILHPWLFLQHMPHVLLYHLHS